jgi:hypothetical protein
VQLSVVQLLVAQQRRGKLSAPTMLRQPGPDNCWPDRDLVACFLQTPPGCCRRRVTAWLLGARFSRLSSIHLKETLAMISRTPHRHGTVVSFRINNNRPTSVVADFNGWNPLLSPMRPAGDNARELNVLLQPGRYAFRYLADGGEWFDETEADLIEPNGQGESHSVLLVK